MNMSYGICSCRLRGAYAHDMGWVNEYELHLRVGVHSSVEQVRKSTLRAIAAPKPRTANIDQRAPEILAACREEG
jgi:hypothetical protein